MLQRSPVLACLLVVLPSLILGTGRAFAQGVVRDSSLGTGRNAPVAGGTDALGNPADYLIPPEMGRQVGRNLLHSFRDFDLAPGEIATFDGTAPIQNIFARITGGRASSIEGALRSSIPGSNLYFLNSAGVLFGPGARLEIPGSFYGSTATQFRLEDGTVFDTHRASEPLLTAAPPAAFGFLDPRGPITVDGSSLSAGTGTLGLIGTDVTISNAEISTSVLEAGKLLFDAQGALTLRDSAILAFGSQGTGHVQLNGDRVSVINGEFNVDRLDVDAKSLFSVGSDPETGFDPLLYAEEAISIRAPDIRFDGALLDSPSQQIEGRRVSMLFSSLLNESGAPSRIVIRADEEIRLDGSSLLARSVSAGDVPSRVDLSTSRLIVENGSSVEAGTVLPTLARPTVRVQPAGLLAPGGDITIRADEVRVLSGSRIDSSSLSSTDGGSIDIEATRLIEVADAESGILAIAVLDGAAGEISLRAPSVVIRDQARVSTETTIDPAVSQALLDLSIGNPLNIPPLADRLKALPTGQGQAGRISIEGDTIAVERGAEVSSATAASGDGGVIRLVAKDSIAITDGASVTANSTGTGNAGRIELIADGITLRDATLATESARTSGGDISLSARVIDVNRSTITTNVGPGDGGNIEIASDVLLVRGESQIIARAREGTGGNILIRAASFLRGQGSVIDASSELGIDGSVEIGSPAADLNSSLAVLRAAYVDPASLLVERCHLRDREGAGSFRVGGRESVPETPERLPRARYASVPDEPGPAERGDPDAFLREIRGVRELSTAERIRTAEALEALGELSAARDVVALALEQAGSPLEPTLLALRGRLWARSGVWSNAERDLGAAARIAEARGDARLLARVLLDRANAEAERGHPERSRELHERSQESARRAGDRDTLARSLAATAGDPKAIDAALAELDALPALHDRLFAELHLGARLAALPGDATRIRAGEVFARVAEKAQALGDASAAAYAWVELADLYAREGRNAEATELSRRALASSVRVERPELVARSSAQLGGLLASAGDLAGTAQAYTVALRALERVRGGTELTARAQAEFAAAFPTQEVSRGLVDALLRQARASTQPEQRARLLRVALGTLESSSRRSIRDFFLDECMALEQETPLDALEDALLIQPVFLNDRVEILVSDARGIDLIAVPAPVERVRAEIESLRQLLEDRSTHDYRAPAAQLYDWLVEPLAPILDRAPAGQTLVFVDSGPLAGVPLGALFDRKRGQFLIEQHPIAVSPGLSLIAPRPLPSKTGLALQAGLTQAMGEFEALAFAGSEVSAVHELVGGKRLVDAEFVTSALGRELASSPYEIVHIASHGRFGPTADDAYVLTFDGRVGLTELADLISRTRFRDRPLELLTLSACQTARGDERAALGLAGVAVRAGARSTLASLWFVNDGSTARLMRAFYAHLVRGSASRAESLQRAQLELLADGVYRHPAYWAPFVLVGSWR